MIAPEYTWSSRAFQLSFWPQMLLPLIAHIPVPRARHQFGDVYKWRSKLGGIQVPLMSQLKKLQDENRRLK